MTGYGKVEACVCKNLKPIAHTDQASDIQKFKDDTGLILRCGRSVNLV